ncbi:MAG TPA: tetratricopeptide repeat protein [Gemmatimonadales bacterium]|nr:tetratricopeptide repeat protein [Gemmatimonadales bacterium]
MDDIQALTTQLARDPSSLVFLPLAEALRRRGQYESALTVAEQGSLRYPEMAGAHDLVARIRSDRGEGDLAFDAWTTVLRLDPDHVGAHKGLAFLCFRAGDTTRSLRYLERAVELAPDDAALRAALDRVREASGARLVPGFAEPAPDPDRAIEAEPGEALLVDREGRVLAGGVNDGAGHEVGDAVAAALAGVTREAERAARLLGLGPWRRIALEGGPAHMELRSPTGDSVLLVMRPRQVPAGRLTLIAERAAASARRWLEELV